MSDTALPAAIQHVIDTAKMSQRELAKITGLSQPTLSRILTGQRTPKMYELLLIADATGVPLTRLTATAQSHNIQFAARSSNGASMEAMQQHMTYFVELNAYLDDQAI